MGTRIQEPTMMSPLPWERDRRVPRGLTDLSAALLTLLLLLLCSTASSVGPMARETSGVLAGPSRAPSDTRHESGSKNNDRATTRRSPARPDDVLSGARPEGEVTETSKGARRGQIETTTSVTHSHLPGAASVWTATNSTVFAATGSPDAARVESGEAKVDSILCEHFSPWSKWRPCNRKCEQSRVRRCKRPEHCGRTWLKENRTCKRKRGPCSTFSYRTVGFRRRNRLLERVLYDVLYTDWSQWGPCTRSCRQRRRRKCTVRDVCHNSFIQETRRCTVSGSRCQRRYSLKPASPVHQDAYDGAEDDVTDTSSAPGQSAAAEGPEGKEEKKKDPKKQKKKKQKKRKEKPTQPRGSKDQTAILGEVQDTCGLRPPGKRGSYRVVGGQEAQRLSWPWQAAILTRWEEQYCAGTLVAPQWLLTAAHCVRKKTRKRRVVIRLGEHDLQVFEGSEDDVRPDKDFPHPDFDYETITNDIALVHLRQAPKDRTQVRYACLPDPHFAPDRGALCHIVGWGKTRNRHLFGAETLHEARVPLVPRKRCRKVFDYHINKTQVCAGYKKGGIDSCAGDSGGPLLCPRTDGGVTRWYLVGITSYGEGCGRRGKYGIYTRVSSYLDWIRNTIESF